MAKAKKRINLKRLIHIMGVFVLLIVIGYVAQLFCFYPFFSYNEELRDIEVVKNIIDNNNNIQVYYKSHFTDYIDIDGNIFSEIYSPIDPNQPLKIPESKDMQVIFVIEFESGFQIIEGRVWYNNNKEDHIYRTSDVNGNDWMVYASRGTLNYSLKESDLGLMMRSGSDRCTYEPYYFAESSCLFTDALKAKLFFKQHLSLLDEIGVSENELIIYARWFAEDIIARFDLSVY